MAPEGDDIDLQALIAGDKRQWDSFCARFAPVIQGAARRALGRADREDVLDAAQETFVRLCRDDFKLLRQFDPQRAKLTTWVAVIAHSAAIDWIRRKRPTTPIDEIGEQHLAVEDRHSERLRIPVGLLTERQALILKLLYDREMDVLEIAKLLQIDTQTVRSTHHKALTRLRAYFDGDKSAPSNV
jgi:RNA polymerase sigma-70 factor (ECF subfamily)